MSLILHLSDEETPMLREFVYMCLESRDARVVEGVKWLAGIIEREEAACIIGSQATLDPDEQKFLAFAKAFYERVGRTPNATEVRKAMRWKTARITYPRVLQKLANKRLLRYYKVQSHKSIKRAKKNLPQKRSYVHHKFELL